MSGCQEKIPIKRTPWRTRQCDGPEWKDGWCATHHPEKEQARRERQHEKYEKQFRERMRKSILETFAPEMKRVLEMNLSAMNFSGKRAQSDGMINRARDETNQLLAALELAISKYQEPKS